jgi:hypothetical protein
VVASGRAASLGIEGRCRGEDLSLKELAPDHLTACYEAWLEPEGATTSPRPASPTADPPTPETAPS